MQITNLTKRIFVIINPISGTASKEQLPALLDQYFSPDKFEKSLFYTEYRGHASELAKRALDRQTDYVIAVGGDGTVNEVARALVHSPATLGIIPMGSGNGLARELLIPMDVRKAMEVIAEENITFIDYCKANEHIFFCTCGLGFDALISERFAGEKRRGALMYVKNVIMEYLKFQPEMYQITFEDQVFQKDAFLVTCANASQYGNNAFIAPQASISDGMMDVTVLSPITPLDVAPLVVQLFTKQITKNSKIQQYRSRKITLKRKKCGVMHIDGEPIQMGESVTVETFRNGLQVLVPRNPMPQVYDVPSFFSYITRWFEEKTKS
ncbi:MAG: diacylglycerol kinase family lipid kinase [Dysgonamonadaceae bacterium]|jgi:YegS/Rv2252/BmrU family lipid kinase|nr:diacylglycerol kinase family lipid kinase [Dysgonamonadaceae bacterium]